MKTLNISENTGYNKWKSRTFILAVLWSAFVPLGLVGAIIMSQYSIHSSGWLTALITGSAAIVTAFVGVEKWRKGTREAAEVMYEQQETNNE